jgi:hypothetical protein
MNIVLFFKLKIGNNNHVDITPIITSLKDRANNFIKINFIKKRIKDKEEYDIMISKKQKHKMYKWMEDIGTLNVDVYNFIFYYPTEKFICSLYDKFIKGIISKTDNTSFIIKNILELFDTIGVNKINNSIQRKTVHIVENILLQLNIVKFNKFIEIDDKFYMDKIKKKVFNIYNSPIVVYGVHNKFYIRLSNFYYIILLSKYLSEYIYIPRLYYQSKNKNIIYYRDIDTFDRYNIASTNDLYKILYQIFKNFVILQEEHNIFIQYLLDTDIRISSETDKLINIDIKALISKLPIQDMDDKIVKWLSNKYKNKQVFKNNSVSPNNNSASANNSTSTNNNSTSLNNNSTSAGNNSASMNGGKKIIVNKVYIDITNCEVINKLSNKVSIGTIGMYDMIHDNWDKPVFIANKDIKKNTYKGYGIYILLISLLSNKKTKNLFFEDDKLVKLWNILWQSETIAREIKEKIINLEINKHHNYQKIKIINSIISGLVLHNHIAIIIFTNIDYILHS